MSTDPGVPTVRSRLLDSALDLFVERGLVEASVEELCARSGASVGSLYHHFGGKVGLAAGVFVEALASYQRGFVAELRRHDDAQAGVRGAVGFHLRFCEEQPQLARFLLGYDVTKDSKADGERRERNRTFFDDVRAWWHPHVRYGVLRELELALLAALWIGPAQEYCRIWLAGSADLTPTQAEPVLAEGAWNALRTEGD